jgi:hypothetical protein
VGVETLITFYWQRPNTSSTLSLIGKLEDKQSQNACLGLAKTMFGGDFCYFLYKKIFCQKSKHIFLQKYKIQKIVRGTLFKRKI